MKRLVIVFPGIGYTAEKPLLYYGLNVACECGYREKLSAFEARRKKEGSGKVDKKSVQKYLNQQQKEEEPINNAFADLLKGMKFD